MSAETGQSRLPGLGAPEPHLDTEPPKKKAINADQHRHEYYCVGDCGKRITRSSTSHVEYGHARDCEYHLHKGGQS